MLRLHGSRWAVAFFFVCFAAQGVSSASISSRTANNEDVDLQEYQLTNALSEDLFFHAVSRNPTTKLITCLTRHLGDIRNLTSEATALFINASRIVSEFIQDYIKCGLDLNCKMGAFVKAFSKVIQHGAQIRSVLNDYKIIANKIFNCTREGITTPAPPTPTTPSPTTPAHTTPAPTTPAHTTPKPTTSAPTTPAPTTPAPITPTPTTPAPITPTPTTPGPTITAPTSAAPQAQVEDQSPSQNSNESASADKDFFQKVPESLKNAYKNGQRVLTEFWSKLRS